MLVCFINRHRWLLRVVDGCLLAPCWGLITCCFLSTPSAPSSFPSSVFTFLFIMIHATISEYDISRAMYSVLRRLGPLSWAAPIVCSDYSSIPSHPIPRSWTSKPVPSNPLLHYYFLTRHFHYITLPSLLMSFLVTYQQPYTTVCNFIYFHLFSLCDSRSGLQAVITISH